MEEAIIKAMKGGWDLKNIIDDLAFWNALEIECKWNDGQASKAQATFKEIEAQSGFDEAEIYLLDIITRGGK